MTEKEALAEALRRYPTFGHAYLAAARLLLDVEGALLGYWTDIPESVIQEWLPKFREVLGGYSPPADEAKQ